MSQTQQPDGNEKLGPRALKLRESFLKATDSFLNSWKPQAVDDCFAGLEDRYLKWMRLLVLQEVIPGIRSCVVAEFADICQEAQVVSKLNALDRLCEEQGVLGNGAAAVTPRPPPELDVSPAQLVRQQLLGERRKEIAELQAQAKALEKERGNLEAALEEKRARVAAVANRLQRVREDGDTVGGMVYVCAGWSAPQGGAASSLFRGVDSRLLFNDLLTMLTRSSRPTLTVVIGTPGIGALVMASLPVPDRIRLRRTCRTFRDAVDESFLALTQLFGEDVAGGSSRPGTTALSWFLAKCPNLTTLSIASRDEHQKPWGERDHSALTWPCTGQMTVVQGVLSLEDIARRYKGLEYLNVAGCQDVCDAGVAAIAWHCRGLTALDVSQCELHDESIRAVAEACPGLMRLVMQCWPVSDDSLVALGQHCHQLAELDAAFTAVTDVGVTALVTNCPRLRRLIVSHSITADGIAKVAAHCPLLEHLGINMCQFVTDDSIKKIADGCPRLRRLDAVFCGIKDEGLTALGDKCKELCHVNVEMTGVSDASILACANNCPRLLHLDVSRCYMVTDVGIRWLAQKCKQLEYLSVARCPLVTNAGISMVAKNCPWLRTLIVNEAGATNIDIGAIGAHCHELRYFDMANMGAYMSLTGLAKGCPKLEYLDVTSSREVNTEAVTALSRYCKQLRVFKAGVTVLDDKDVAKLIQERGRQLRELDFSDSLITDDTLKLVAQKCPLLQGLKVAGTCITDKGIKLLAHGCKELRHLDVERCDLSPAALRLLDGERCEVKPWHVLVDGFDYASD
eukprot:jgi/Mesvir1/24948/Mv16922-RA.1